MSQDNYDYESELSILTILLILFACAILFACGGGDPEDIHVVCKQQEGVYPIELDCRGQ